MRPRTRVGVAPRVRRQWQPGGLHDVVRNGRTVSATYDPQDRMLTHGSTTYTYGANGELATKTGAGQTTTYTYDALGQLTKVVLPEGRTIEYVYDGLQRRVGKKVDGQLVQRLLYRGQLHPVAELDGAGNVISRFVYGTRSHVPDYLVRDGTTYIITDHLGSARLVVNTTNGNISQRMDYDAWGNVLANSAPGFQLFGFAGGLYDVDTGLVHFGARDYDPTVGRWTAKDPSRFGGGANQYFYSGADPVNYIDANGRWILPAAGAVIGAGASLLANRQAYLSGRMTASDYAAAAIFSAGTGALAGFTTGVGAVSSQDFWGEQQTKRSSNC